jgi:hypothetical protein
MYHLFVVVRNKTNSLFARILFSIIYYAWLMIPYRYIISVGMMYVAHTCCLPRLSWDILMVWLVYICVAWSGYKDTVHSESQQMIYTCSY